MKKKNQPPPSQGRILLAFGLIWAAMCLVFVVMGIRQIQSERRFDVEGALASGVIAAKWVKETNGIDSKTKQPTVSRTCYLTLKFRTGRGQEIESDITVSQSEWDGTETPSPAQIQYLPAEPAKCRIAGSSGMTQACVFTGLGGAGVLLGLFLAIFSVRKSDR